MPVVAFRSYIRRIVTALSLAVLTLVSPADAQSIQRVTRVIDGDTVVLASLGTVRLIGVDTPETVDPRKAVQYFGKEASAFLTTLVLGNDVRIAYDSQRTDRYHRTLAYLYLADGTFVNLEIVRQGYGHAYLTFPFQMMDVFRAAERDAREAARGLWASAATESVSIPPASIRVWVNTASQVYHCPGARHDGTTRVGVYLTQDEAQALGHRPASGRTCR